MVKHLKENRGQAIVEFALVLPFLLTLLLGIIEFGWLFNSWLTITSSAREGARVAAVNIDVSNDSVQMAVKRHVEGLSGFVFDDVNYTSKNSLDAATLSVGHAAVAIEPWDINNRSPGSEVAVYVKGSVKPLVGVFVQHPVEIWGQAVMRRE
ncbi:MAG: pilus assembly protein [Peptococcaceae bacterium]|nr:pilus assembly protein [Peptococcaceae bacterium]